jgi:3-oxoacyl-[acyl-carrier-protein] synthase-3
MDDYDCVSIHQANKMIVDNVAKRIKAPPEKVLWSLDRYGNTRGASTAMNICDYAEYAGVRSETKRILNLAFGIGLNIVVADFEMDMGCVLPVIKTTEVFDDGITNYSYFADDEE